MIDRDLRIRIDAVLAATIFSLLAAIAAIVLVVSANDESATKDQVHALRSDVEGVGDKAAAAQRDVNSASSRLDTVEGDIATLSGKAGTNEHELTAVQSDVKDLRDQISKLKDAVARESAANAGAGGSAANQKSAASP
jgi:septal ring factor EnvC (AmiA/AmiB activator)